MTPSVPRDPLRRLALGQAGALAVVLALPLVGLAGTARAQAPGTGLPPGIGQGPGFHDPRSAFKPLQDREGVVSWSLLSSVQLKPERARVVPVFPPAVQALHEKTVKVPSGPGGLVEVRTRTPVKYTVDAITVEGRMAVLANDRYGLLYRVTEAEPVP